jgi:hypothetical protein
MAAEDRPITFSRKVGIPETARFYLTRDGSYYHYQHMDPVRMVKVFDRILMCGLTEGLKERVRSAREDCMMTIRIKEELLILN